MGSKRVDTVILCAIIVVAFFGSLILVRRERLSLSPDETANVFFAETFARTGRLFSFEPLNAQLDDVIHPRSVASIDGRLVPVSFVGLPFLYGSLAAVFGEGVIPFMTPILAALAVFAWYAIVRKLFGQEIAFISAALLAIHPGWWYYTARSLMHNVPFTALLIFSAYALIVRPLRTRFQDHVRLAFLSHIDLILAGVLFGTALFFRTSEAIWAALALALVTLFFRKTVSLRSVLLFALSAFLALSPLFFINRELYGSPFSFGYTVKAEGSGVVMTEASVPSVEPQVSSSFRASVESALRPVFPFGIHPRAALRHINAYGLSLFWWMTAFALVGFWLLVPKRGQPPEERRVRGAYVAALVFVAAWLGMMYGSWTVNDNPDPTVVTIANSYVRYWLPVFVMTTPIAAFAINWLSRRPITEWARRVSVAVLLCACLGLSIRAVFFAPQDGLIEAAALLDRSAEIRTRVLARTEPESVIIVDRADKLFFPHRRVVFPLRDERTYELMPRIVLRVPLYYYGVTFPPQDIEYLNTLKLKEHGLQIEFIETFDEESLYRIYQP